MQDNGPSGCASSWRSRAANRRRPWAMVPRRCPVSVVATFNLKGGGAAACRLRKPGHRGNHQHAAAGQVVSVAAKLAAPCAAGLRQARVSETRVAQLKQHIPRPRSLPLHHRPRRARRRQAKGLHLLDLWLHPHTLCLAYHARDTVRAHRREIPIDTARRATRRLHARRAAGDVRAT